MRYFLTGHTGFKGSWLTVMLLKMGHEVHGYSFDVPKGGLFERANMTDRLDSDTRGDVRDRKALTAALAASKPDVVIHLAAQPLVRASYENPLDTIEINAMGTINLLAAMAEVCPDAFALVVTTDKVYANTSKKTGYVESDNLGASDPYSTSKAMADLGAQSWAKSFPNTPRLAIARAGNVIGPLDSSSDRLVPDFIRAKESGAELEIRFPNATRPWQYVLDCLAGYLLLIEKQVECGTGAWNFGPLPTHEKSVLEVIEIANRDSEVRVKIDESSRASKPEHGLLTLDSSKARNILDWEDRTSFEDAVQFSIHIDATAKLLGQNASGVWNLVSDHVDEFNSRT